jgi:hypothetical protein
MKVKMLIVTLLLTLGMVTAQGIGWGIKGGISSNAATLDLGDEITVPVSNDGLVGAVAGGYLDLDLIFIGAQVEALYAQKGLQLSSAGISEDITLNYLSIPVTAKFTLFPFVVKPYIGAGVEYSYLLSVSGKDPFVGESISKDDFESSDFSAVARLGADFSLGVVDLNADLRYIYGLNNVSKISGFDVKNNSLQLTVGLAF